MQVYNCFYFHFQTYPYSDFTPLTKRFFLKFVILMTLAL